MASLHVRELPVQIYEKLKKEAGTRHRSLAQQAVITLAKGLNTPYSPQERRIFLLENLENDLNYNDKYKLSDPVNMIREDREHS